MKKMLHAVQELPRVARVAGSYSGNGIPVGARPAADSRARNSGEEQ